MKRLTAGVFAFLLSLNASQPWVAQETGVKSRFRGLSVVDSDVAWASGSQGTCVRTGDGGKTWKRVEVPGAAGLDFRDVQAFDDKTAVLLSIGAGELSRIYKTIDGGSSWSLLYTNPDPKGFLDAISFWDRDHGIALGDPVNGRFTILTTDDGGRTWAKIADSGMPEALAGEGAFAASGTCLTVQGTSNAWFGTGGATETRVFRSTDRGRTWSAVSTPIRGGIASAGVFSVAFRDADHGLAVGGDYRSVDDPTGNLAITVDGGRTWTKPETGRPGGFRSAVAYVPGTDRPVAVAVAVGPAGSDVTRDGGATWTKLEGPGFHAFGFGVSGRLGLGAGENGRIGRLDPAVLTQP